MQEHQIADDGDPRRHWTQIPNIVYELRLTPFELALYSHLKRTAGAGKSGKCTKSVRTLADETGMSPALIRKAKQSLSRPRPELNNKPLIRITEEPTRRGGKDSHLIRIVDIWRDNANRFSPPEQVSNITLDQVSREGDPSVTESVKQGSDVAQKNNSDQEKPEEQLPRARAGGLKKPRQSGSFDDRNDKSPKFGIEEIRTLPDDWQDRTRAEMRKKYSELNYDDVHEEWCKSRMRDGGLGRYKTPAPTLVQFSMDIEIFFGNWQRNHTNGYGYGYGNGAKPEPPRQRTQYEILKERGEI